MCIRDRYIVPHRYGRPQRGHKLGYGNIVVSVNAAPSELGSKFFVSLGYIIHVLSDYGEALGADRDNLGVLNFRI